MAVPIALGQHALPASVVAPPDAKAAKADAKATKILPSKSAKGEWTYASERLSRSSKSSKSAKGAASPSGASQAKAGVHKDAYDAKAEKVSAGTLPRGKQSKNGTQGATDGAAVSGKQA